MGHGSKSGNQTRGSKSMSWVAPPVQLFLMWLAKRFLPAGHRRTVLRGDAYFLYGGFDSVLDEMWDHAGHAQQQGELKHEFANLPERSQECCQKTWRNPVRWLHRLCNSIGDSRARWLMFTVVASLLVKATPGFMVSLARRAGGGRGAFSESHVDGLSTFDSPARAPLETLVRRVPLLWGPGETVGLLHDMNHTEVINSTTGKAVRFPDGDGLQYRAVVENPLLFLDDIPPEDTVSVSIVQCLASPGGDDGQLSSCLTTPGMHDAASKHSVQVSKASVQSAGMQRNILDALVLRSESGQGTESVLPWLPFTQQAYHFRYQDEELQGAEVDCMSTHEIITWVCMFSDQHGTWIVDPTNRAVTMQAALDSNREEELDFEKEFAMPALVVTGVGQFAEYNWTLIALSLVAQINAQGWNIHNKFDTFSMAVALARPDYLQRDMVPLCVLPVNRLVLSWVWLVLMGVVAVCVVGAGLKSCGGGSLHVPKNGWEWYLQGSRESENLKRVLAAKGVELLPCPECEHKPDMKFDVDVGLLTGPKGVKHVTWMHGGDSASKEALGIRGEGGTVPGQPPR